MPFMTCGHGWHVSGMHPCGCVLSVRQVNCWRVATPQAERAISALTPRLVQLGDQPPNGAGALPTGFDYSNRFAKFVLAQPCGMCTRLPVEVFSQY